MKHKIAILFIISSVSTVLLLILYLASAETTPNNGFKRSLSDQPFPLIHSYTLSHSRFYFAGWTNNTCYLGNIQRPDRLLSLSYDSIQEIFLPRADTNALSDAQIVITPPYFYVADLRRYIIYRGTVSNWNTEKAVHRSSFFTEFVPIDSVTIFLRAFKSGKKEFVLAREGTSTHRIENTELLEKQVDGLFCVDGILDYDSMSQLMVYTYFYRNQFIIADKNLNLLYRANTIDTVSQARIKVAKDRNTLASPPFVTNRKAAAYEGMLYINSNLKADNEDPADFEKNDIIDVYQLSDGRYRKSFYIPKYEGKHLRHFKIHDGQIYVLNQNVLRLYHLPDSLELNRE